MNNNLLPYPLNYKELAESYRDKDSKKIIVLDDDPTGSQTVYDLPIYTKINSDIITEAFQDEEIKAFYILTNTRAMPEEKAEEINIEIAQLIDQVSKKTGIDYEIISRGDSTLRGHFPLELDIIKDHISKSIDGYIFIPFFDEGGRVTIDDVHYVRENSKLIPVSETQYAKDHTFGFNSSNLRDYVAEKSKGKISKEDVVSISIGELRNNSDSVLNMLLNLNGRVCIVNAEKYEDIKAFTKEVIVAETQGKNYLFRTAASFVKARLGLEDRALLDGNMLDIPKDRGGIIVAGSYVNKTTQQITDLINEKEIERIELDVSVILEKTDSSSLANKIAKQMDKNILRGVDTLLYTSRKILLGCNEYTSLDIGNKISRHITDIVKKLEQSPAFIVAKGGITSNDIATEALNIERAMVCGQIAKGVPVWRCGSESKFEGLIYVVFPGNVGDAQELTRVVSNLRRR